MKNSIDIIDAISLEMDPEFLCRALFVKPGSDMAARLGDLVAEARDIARPKAAYREIAIQSTTEDGLYIDGIELKSRLLRTNLTSAKTLYAFIATCGTELEAWAKKYTDLLESFWTDTIMNIALGAAIGPLEKQLQPHCQDHFLSSMNPGGLEDWPLTEQRPLFRILGTAPADIGIILTDSCLLLPLKSVSGIYFDSAKDFCNCQLCPREACPGRRVPRISEQQE
jgi:hypothetical protein